MEDKQPSGTGTLKYAYLYTRVSSIGQVQDGEGLKRQRDNALKFLDSRPEYTLNEQSYIDEGVSSFDGSNLAREAGLGGFIYAAQQGKIPRGSLLLVESADRLTRLGIKRGQKLFDTIHESGIDIGLVRFGTILKHDDENDITAALIASVGLYLAHLESKQKSERIRHTIGIRRDEARVEGGKKRTSLCPPWLELSEDRTYFKIIEAKANVVRSIYDIALTEGIGADAITRRFNEEGLSPIAGKRQVRDKDGVKQTVGEKWNKATINTYLRSRSVLGEFQPKSSSKNKETGKREDINEGPPIPNYYPPIIDEETFDAVQHNRKPKTLGRNGQFPNLLKGLSKCNHCGGTMHAQSDKRKGIDHRSLKCARRIQNQGCTAAKPVNLAIIESVVETMLRMIPYKMLNTSKSNSVLATDLKQLKLETSAIQTKIDNLITNLETVEDEDFKNQLRARGSNLQKDKSAKEKIIQQHTSVLISSSEVPDLPKLDLTKPTGRQEYNLYLHTILVRVGLCKNEMKLRFKGQEHDIIIKDYLTPDNKLRPHPSQLIDMLLSGYRVEEYDADGVETGGGERHGPITLTKDEFIRL